VDSVISDDMRSILGLSIGGSVSYPVSTSDIRRWAVAVYYPEPPPRHFVDEEYARTTPFGGIVAPEEFNPFAWGAADTVSVAPPKPPLEVDPALAAAGAGEHRYGVKPPDLRHGLNGGVEVEHTGVRMRPGDVITTSTAIVDYREREGRLGVMLFTTNESRWTNQNDELVRIDRMTLIRY
jgi:N-terminal half of MaoC dehydratase